MPERVVLVAIDGLDWMRLREGVAAGRLPAFRGLLEQGACAEVEVGVCVPGLSGPERGMASPVLWTTVATGQYYFQHGVYDFSNAMESVEHPPLFESRHVRSPRLWDVLTAREKSSLVVGYYVTHPAYPIRGVMISDLFGEVASRDVVSPPDRCDEFAAFEGQDRYENLVRPGGQAAGAETTDARRSDPAAFERVLCRFTGLTQTEISALYASPDKTRLRDLIEYRLVYPYLRDERFHRCFVTLLRNEDWQFATLYYRLIDFVSHGFWERGREGSEDELRRYGHVVDRAYEWIDRRVSEIQKCLEPGDRLIVLSDHGFRARERSEGAATSQDAAELCYGEHAEPAVLIVGGGYRRGMIENVTLLDIAPTILDFLGIPLADTLDGGVVPGLLAPETPRSLAGVPAYPYNPPSSTAQMTGAEEKAVLQRLTALGYVE